MSVNSQEVTAKTMDAQANDFQDFELTGQVQTDGTAPVEVPTFTGGQLSKGVIHQHVIEPSTAAPSKQSSVLEDADIDAIRAAAQGQVFNTTVMKDGKAIKVSYFPTRSSSGTDTPVHRSSSYNHVNTNQVQVVHSSEQPNHLSFMPSTGVLNGSVQQQQPHYITTSSLEEPATSSIVFPPIGIIDDGITQAVPRAPLRYPIRIIAVDQANAEEFAVAEYNSALLYLNRQLKGTPEYKTLPFLRYDNETLFLPKGTPMPHVYADDMNGGASTARSHVETTISYASQKKTEGKTKRRFGWLACCGGATDKTNFVSEAMEETQPITTSHNEFMTQLNTQQEWMSTPRVRAFDNASYKDDDVADRHTTISQQNN